MSVEEVSLGPKQSLNMLNMTIDEVPWEMGFSRFITEHGICMVGEGEQRVFLALDVDDLLIVWNSKEALAEIKERLKKKFKMKDLGSAQLLLGVEIKRRLEGGCSII